jgi:hypothetical protein
MKLNLKSKNDEERKSSAKSYHNFAKSLVIAWLISFLIDKKVLITVELKFVSLALLCVTFGLSVENSIGRNDNDQS